MKLFAYTQKGFTLIELLIVIAIIGVLAGVVLIGINPAQRIKEARDTVRKADVKATQKALEVYFIKNGRYPRTDALSTAGGFWITDSFSAPVVAFDTNYMKKIPVDPTNTGDPQTAGLYGYWYIANGWGGCPHSTVYLLAARLENSSDPQAGNTVTVCPGITFSQAGLYAIVAP